MTKEVGRKNRVKMVMVFMVSLSRAARMATRFESSAMVRLILLSRCVTRLKTWNARRMGGQQFVSRSAEAVRKGGRGVMDEMIAKGHEGCAYHIYLRP